MRTFSTVSAAIAVAVLSACASSRDVEGVLSSSGTGCTRCHGRPGDPTGAPPTDVQGLTSSAAVGAHTAHLAAGVACASCHRNVNLADQGFPGHLDDVVNVDFGAAAVDPSGLTSPAYAAATHTCSNVYCHAPSTAPGGNLPAPAWTETLTGCAACHEPPGTVHGGIAATACVTCHAATVDASGALVAGGAHANRTVDAYTHPAGWATPNANARVPHGLAATYQDRAAYPTGFEGCKTCHGSTLANPVLAAIPSCDSAAAGCHGGAAWRTSCTFCHGDATRVASPAAPPFDAAGSSTSARVGAHQVHLVGKAVSNGVACDDCHGGADRTLPGDFVHANGTTEVALKQPGQNAVTGSFDASAGSCANTYCHGNLPRNPKAGNTPSWSSTSGQASCDACHAANGAYAGGVTTGLHQVHRCEPCHQNNLSSTFSTGVGCFACHPGSQRQMGTVPPVVSLALHVDGAVEVVGTTSGLRNSFPLTLTYTPPSGSTPASCTTNCHSIGNHASAGAPAGSSTW